MIKLVVKHRKNTLVLLILLCSLIAHSQEKRTLRIFDKALFWDGYAKDTIMRDTPAEGVIRFSTSLFSKRIKPSQLDSIGDSLMMNVIIKASCDNYDRIGYVGLAFVPKNQTTYDKSKVKRMEIARFITPFMNKNKAPDTVPYSYDISNLISIFKDKKIKDSFDFWFELSVFGVPYAANTQIPGCAGRKDVFFGTLDLLTNDNMVNTDSNNYVSPLMYNFSFNNYQTNASDSIGINSKTLKIVLTDSIQNATLYLITSNHGADSAGEEYSRRSHYIYFDKALILQYIPGFESCEPYRKYNTQSNGIYGTSVKSNAQWQSFSNWCPGAYIPIRVISLGNLSKGTHEFKLSVPDALFVKKSGYFPLSLYMQGVIVPKVTKSSISINNSTNTISIYPNPVFGNQFTISLEEKSSVNINLLSIDGKLVYSDLINNNLSKDIVLNQDLKGIFILQLELKGEIISKKLIFE